jgi:hypothetical protein
MQGKRLGRRTLPPPQSAGAHDHAAAIEQGQQRLLAHRRGAAGSGVGTAGLRRPRGVTPSCEPQGWARLAGLSLLLVACLGSFCKEGWG